jgi:flagellar motility protein MotE (MotC chaperone)
MAETPIQPTSPAPDVAAKRETTAVEKIEADSAVATAQEATGLAQTASTDAQMAKLGKLLESMKPDEAAAIASQLTIDQIVVLVMRMKDRAAGKMLAALPVDQAAQVAVKMSKSTGQTKVRS